MALVADSLSRHARRMFLSIAFVAALAAIACLSNTAALAATSSTSCNLYASNSGSDNNPGTASAPFATAKHLLEKLSAGQIGCLASGQTFAGFTLYEGNTHGAEGSPITLTSTNPEEPATLDGRVTTERGSNWVTFTHLNFVYGQETVLPSITIGSAHTSWTYDDVSGASLNICFLTNPVGDSYGTGEYTLIEHDRVHNCGHPVTKVELETQSNLVFENHENGWHVHGLYDEGVHTTVKNSYFYDSSGVGILLRSGGFAVVEHNVIDANGRGVEIGNEGSEDDTIAWNLITNSTSPCGKEVGGGSHCDTYGFLTSGNVGSDNVLRNNDLYGNEGANVEPGVTSVVGREANVEVNPLYTNGAAHEYTLEADSPVVGYGPDTAQPGSGSAPPTKTAPVSPPVNTETTPVETAPVSPPANTETTPVEIAPVAPPASTETTPTKTAPVSPPVNTETTPVETAPVSPPANTETDSLAPPANTETTPVAPPAKPERSGSRHDRHRFDSREAKIASTRTHRDSKRRKGSRRHKKRS